ncbi:hypothetical protein Tco_1317553 [Tanacetum coccineum]
MPTTTTFVAGSELNNTGLTRPIAMAPAVAPRMPMYPPGGSGMGQQIFGQQPTFIPPQPGFGYQQQLVSGMRPGGAPIRLHQSFLKKTLIPKRSSFDEK